MEEAPSSKFVTVGRIINERRAEDEKQNRPLGKVLIFLDLKGSIPDLQKARPFHILSLRGSTCV